jgi:hypothetical protein
MSGEATNEGGNGAVVVDAGSQEPTGVQGNNTPVAADGGNVQPTPSTVASARADQQTAPMQQTKPPVPPAPTYSPALLARAKQSGFSQADIEQYGSEDLAEAALNAFDRKMGEMALRQQQPTQQPTQQPAQQPAAFQPAQPPQQPLQQPTQRQTQQPSQPQVDQTINFLDGISDDVNDPEMVKALGNFQEHYAATHQRVDKLEADLKSVVSHLVKQVQRAEAADFDGFIESLGDEWSDVYGKGRFTELSREGEHHQNRVKLAQAAHAIRQGYQLRGLDAPDLRVLLDREHRALFGKRNSNQSSASQQASDQPRGVNGRFTPVSRPTGGNSNPAAVNQDRVAEENVRRKLREFGVKG